MPVYINMVFNLDPCHMNVHPLDVWISKLLGLSQNQVPFFGFKITCLSPERPPNFETAPCLVRRDCQCPWSFLTTPFPNLKKNRCRWIQGKQENACRENLRNAGAGWITIGDVQVWNGSGETRILMYDLFDHHLAESCKYDICIILLECEHFLLNEGQ